MRWRKSATQEVARQDEIIDFAWLDQRFRMWKEDRLKQFFLRAPQVLPPVAALWPVLSHAYPQQDIWLVRYPVPRTFYRLPQSAPVIQVLLAFYGQDAHDAETERLFRLLDAAGLEQVQFFWQLVAEGPAVTFLPWLPEHWEGTPYQAPSPPQEESHALLSRLD